MRVMTVAASRARGELTASRARVELTASRARVELRIGIDFGEP